MSTYRSPATAGPPRWGLALFLLASALLLPGMAFASYTLEGCRNNGGISLPNGDGNFICANAAYTTGNLGKGWNELDLVPFRTTVTNSGTYTFANVLDNSNGGHPGYDVISAPVLNTALSSATGCSAASSGAQLSVNGINGVDTSIYRLLTVTQTAGSTCVYDWYGRLALGSHEFSGSSLHANLLNSQLTESGIGNKEVSIPVKEISPQSLSKDMAAVVNSSYVWNLTKSGDPAEVSFGDVCASATPTPQTVAITIAWTKSAAVLGKVNITTNVYATNPSSRTIETTVTDVIYKGTDLSTPLDTSAPVTKHVGAGDTELMITHTVALDASVAGNIGDYLNDVATATYTDDVTGIPIPGDETATASTQIKSGSSSDATADLTDSESISGTGLSFSVAAPLVGSFSNYTADTPVDETFGSVNWSALAQSATGSVTFDKTIYLDSPLAGDLGKLSDTANLYSPNKSTPDQSLEKSLDIAISSTATVKLTVSKTIPANYPGAFLNQPGDLLKVHFHVAGALGYSTDFTFTFDSSTPCDVSGCTLSTDLLSLTPDTFTVTETGSELCPLGTCTDPATSSFLQPASNPLQKDLTIPVNGDMTGRCSGTVAFTNILNAQGVKAEVEKVTAPVLASDDPDYLWTFTLAGPNVSTCLPVTVGAGAGFVTFTDSSGVDPCLLSDGDYTVTESVVGKDQWQQDGATPPGADPLVCAFSVNLITDDGKTFSCTFHNTKFGHVNVTKTVLGLPPSGTDAFTFTLREGASASQDGTIDETLVADALNGGSLSFVKDLVPGNHYQLCEIVMPGWLTTLSSLPGAFNPPNGGDNSVVCVDFTVNAGETKTFTVDNTPPPGGNARTIGFWKNWASCRQSRGHQAPVLDETLIAATPPGIKVGNYVYLTTGECRDAVNLLNKSTMTGGVKMASDPLFNMTAQLVAAELNIVAGAAHCSKVDAAIVSANLLLSTYFFDGTTYHPALSKADRVLANNLATELDNYNNNLPSACL